MDRGSIWWMAHTFLRQIRVKSKAELKAVAQSLLQLWHHVSGHIHATAAALVGQGEDESPVFAAPSASSTIGADTGLADFRHGAFDGRPEFFQLAEEIPV
jgi:hypothetical protein